MNDSIKLTACATHPVCYSPRQTKQGQQTKERERTLQLAMLGLRKIKREWMEAHDANANWPWSLQRLAEEDDARSISRTSSLRSEDHEIDDVEERSSQKSGDSPFRGTQFAMDEPWFPQLPPPMTAKYPRQYGVLKEDGSIVFFDGTRVNARRSFRKLKYVDEVEKVEKVRLGMKAE